LPVPSRPRQIQFARLDLSNTVLSKRRLLQLVNERHVSGWDDPRMPTLSGVSRRGFSPVALRAFCEQIGVAKRDSVVDVAMLEHSIREDLNRRAPRVMAVLRPLKVVIENYPDEAVEELEAVNNPEDPDAGTRRLPFSRELYIEREDFMEEPPSKFFRLAPGREVRLRYAYIIKCERVVKDPATGAVVELRCSYDPETRSGSAASARKVKATLHWVSARHAITADVRLYDRLFVVEHPDAGKEGDWLAALNPEALTILSDCRVEPSLATVTAGDRFQFERQGYFCVDSDATVERLVFNRTVTLRDTWAKIQAGPGR
jgi:glutaminyl-tRNA synthetase